MIASQEVVFCWSATNRGKRRRWHEWMIGSLWSPLKSLCPPWLCAQTPAYHIASYDLHHIDAINKRYKENCSKYIMIALQAGRFLLVGDQQRQQRKLAWRLKHLSKVPNNEMSNTLHPLIIRNNRSDYNLCLPLHLFLTYLVANHFSAH